MWGRKKISDEVGPAGPDTRAAADRRPLLHDMDLWTKGDWPRVDVVGEFFHKAAYRRILPSPVPRDGTDISVRAHLIPEPGNRHDPNAVAVSVDGLTIGHLAKEIAPEYQPMLIDLNQRGRAAVVTCHIHANEFSDGQSGRPDLYVSAALVLDEPWMCLPINAEPSAPFALLPYGSAVQARKEEEHKEVLAAYLDDHGERWAWGTLHRIEVGGARTQKAVVEIHLDGRTVGELTPAMSEKYLPVVDELQSCGRLTAARVIVKGNRVRADVILHAMKANELTKEWLDSNLAEVIASPRRQADSEPVAEQADVLAKPLRGVQPLAPAPGPLPVEMRVAHPATHRYRFNTPPGWQDPPPDWCPPSGWKPPASWPPAPDRWTFWSVIEEGSHSYKK